MHEHVGIFMSAEMYTTLGMENSYGPMKLHRVQGSIDLGRKYIESRLKSSCAGAIRKYVRWYFPIGIYAYWSLLYAPHQTDRLCVESFDNFIPIDLAWGDDK